MRRDLTYRSRSSNFIPIYYLLVREQLGAFSVIPARHKDIPIWNTHGRYRKQMKLLDIYRSSKAGDMNLVFQSPIVFNRMYATDKVIEHFEMFGKLGMQKEIECVLDSVWKIYTDYKLYAFPEPHLYNWSNFDYTKDDWRKLIALQKQYPDQTYRNYFNLIHGVNKG